MAQHALLSASAAHRWLVCTAAPRFEAQFPAETSAYAEEGTLAHSVCELHARKKFTPMSTRKFNAELKKLQEHELYHPEMLTTAKFYVQYLYEKALTYDHLPHVNLEVRVDLSDIIPEGFGTCDCVMIGGNTLYIVDYKHGKGVAVSAQDNPQMRLYALGALKRYAPIYGNSIKHVSMGICQPRITEDGNEESLSVEALIAWGERSKEIAQVAYSDQGQFVPGEHCRFCRAKAVCRARAMQNTALEEFKDCIPAGKAEGRVDSTARTILGLPPTLSNDEVADLLIRGAVLVQWYKDLEDYALGAILQGASILGFKAVEGRSNRAFSNTDNAVQIILDAGYERDKVYEPKSLAELEKIVGKKKFAELVGELIFRPRGKPTLARESDKRKPYDSAAIDFEGVGNEK